jgi:hypothetical protein
MRAWPLTVLLRCGVLPLAFVSCGNAVSPNGVGSGEVELRARAIVNGLSAPVHLTAPAGDGRLFVVEQAGRIRIIENGQLRTAPFLDITSLVLAQGEQGLLSVAFHPDHAANGFFYVDYIDRSGDTRVVRYRVSADPNVADPGSAELVLQVEQPFSNHNGGLVTFGPDGLLYIGLGDGGSGGDPFGHGQNRATLLGSILRIDVDGGAPYVIPSDNPFRGVAGSRGEIWAYGLRNPWRFSFDPPAERLYIADVGQNQWEELNAVAARTGGVNYGWNVMEGMHCFQPANCSQAGLTLPVLEYGHGEGCSVIGGDVYRGSGIPEIAGHYFYADLCQGWVRSFRVDGTQVSERIEWPLGDLGSVLSFGTDAAGELYVLSANGTVYRIEAVR